MAISIVRIFIIPINTSSLETFCRDKKSTEEEEEKEEEEYKSYKISYTILRSEVSYFTEKSTFL